MCAHIVERKQAFLDDGIDDLALAYAVAATNFRLGSKHGNARGVAVTGIAEIVLSHQDGAAETADVRTFAQHLEIPGPVEGIAVHHGAFDAVIADDEFLVDAGSRVLQYQRFITLVLVERAGGKQVDAGDLELGRSDRTLVLRNAEIGQVICGDFRLFE